MKAAAAELPRIQCARELFGLEPDTEETLFSLPGHRRRSMHTYNGIDPAQHTTAVIDDAATDTCPLSPHYNGIKLEEEGGKEKGTSGMKGHITVAVCARRTNQTGFSYIYYYGVSERRWKKEEIIQYPTQKYLRNRTHTRLFRQFEFQDWRE